MSFQSKHAAVIFLFVGLVGCSKSSKGSKAPAGQNPPPIAEKSCSEKQKDYVFKSDNTLNLTSSVEDVISSALRKEASFWEALPKCEN